MMNQCYVWCFFNSCPHLVSCRDRLSLSVSFTVFNVKITIYVSPCWIATYLASLQCLIFGTLCEWGVQLRPIYFHLHNRLRPPAEPHFISSSDHLRKRDSPVKLDSLRLSTEAIFVKGTSDHMLSNFGWPGQTFTWDRVAKCRRYDRYIQTSKRLIGTMSVMVSHTFCLRR